VHPPIMPEDHPLLPDSVRLRMKQVKHDQFLQLKYMEQVREDQFRSKPFLYTVWIGWTLYTTLYYFGIDLVVIVRNMEWISFLPF
jgi:hypothetical protein